MRKPLLFVLLIVCAAQLLRLALLEHAIPGFVRGGSTFVITSIPVDTAVSQEFAARRDGLATVAIDGSGTHGGRAMVEVSLHEIWNAGEREVRRATLELLAGHEGCCALRFRPVENSKGRRYRLELTIRKVDHPDFQLALRAKPVPEEGGLVINGIRQRANLVLDADDVSLAPPKGQPRVSLALLIACFAVIDTAVAWVVYSLWRSAGSASAPSSAPS